jgi:hypothetical protein
MPLDTNGATTLIRIILFVPLLLLTLTSACLAEEKPGPCANQDLELATQKYGTPGYDSALKNFQACLAIAAEQKKAEYADTRDAWAASLDKLPNGGWIFLMVSPDGTYAIFGSHRHATREGNIAAIWLRYEYRDQQKNNMASQYRSEVERDMYDCSRITFKGVAFTYYASNNLGGDGLPYTYDEAKVAWTPAIPGTVGDSLLDWACKTTSRPRAKPQ